MLRRALLKGRRAAETVSVGVRASLRPDVPHVSLDGVRRRLEIVLAATYGRPIPVSELPDTRPARGVRRLVATVQQRRQPPIATTDGVGVLLPPSMPEGMPADEAITQYRLLAMEQAERLVRDSAQHAPTGDPLLRDLFVLREAAAVDSAIVRKNVGLAEPLARARRDALRARPPLDGMTEPERAVELLVRETLAREPTDHTDSPAESLEWAQRTAAALRAAPGEYRGVRPVALWGTPGRSSQLSMSTTEPVNVKSVEAASSRRGSGLIPLGMAATSSTAPPKANAKAAVTSAPPDPDAPPLELPEDLQLPARALQPGTQNVQSVDHGADDDAETLPPGIGYPEWDHGTGRYQANGAIVRSAVADEGDASWADGLIASNATLLRRVQQQFERLRARRVRLLQQRRGDEIDIAACVRAIIDRRAGLLGEDRLYTDVRPARRGLAISLLVDVSGSTDMQVTHELQVIDIEKLAVLLATKAFDALGDSYNVLTFTGRGASDVRMKTVKAFNEPSGAVVRRRIAALRPEGGTRMGAAVRHAVALLAAQPAGHRLLLILSDGRPNDIGYIADYAVEDARQSILEARAAGIFPFCLTIDRDGAEYLAHVFGSAGHVIIGNPEQLPSALLRAVRQLLRFA